VILCHTADWEIGPSGDRLDRETGLNAAMMDRYRCARFVIEDALERGAQIILHAGDLWRGAGESAFGCRPTPTQVWLARQAFGPALGRGVPIVIILGNHDAARSPAEKHALDLLHGIEGLTVTDRPEMLWAYQRFWERDPDLSERWFVHAARPAESYPGPLLQLALLPYPNAGLLLRDEEARKLDPGQRNLLVREKMMDCLRGLAAQRIEGVPCLLLVHAAFDTAEAGKQNSLAMLSAEWTLNLHEVAALGFDLVLAGHYHRHQTVQESPWIGYCGSPEATGFGEQDEAKGYIDWQSGPNGWEGQFIETPYRRLVTLTAEDFQVRDDGSTDVECEPIPEGAIVRLEIPAASWLTVEDARRAIEAAGAFEARVIKGRAETQRRRESAVSSEMSAAEALRAWLETKPDLHPIADALVTEAIRVEGALGGGGTT